VTELGQGGGLMGLSADYTPPSRFVRQAYLKQFAYQASNSTEAVQLAGHFLNNVDMPAGVARSTDDKFIEIDLKLIFKNCPRLIIRVKNSVS
jgi:choloylglycine hydrolase